MKELKEVAFDPERYRSKTNENAPKLPVKFHARVEDAQLLTFPPILIGIFIADSQLDHYSSLIKTETA